MSIPTLTLPRSYAALALVAAFGTSPAPAVAQEVTPTHTFESPLVLDPFTGSVVFATIFAPTAGETIVSTDIHVAWTTDGSQSAAAFGVHIDGFTEQGAVSWATTGADLGWGSRSQTWVADIETDELNGTTLSGPFGGPTFNLVMEAAGGGGLWGVLEEETRFFYRLGPNLQVDVETISIATGGTQTLDMNAGPVVGPGKFFVVVGSSSGTTADLQVAGVNVPLVLDDYTEFTLASANKGVFGGTLGSFGCNCRVTPTRRRAVGARLESVAYSPAKWARAASRWASTSAWKCSRQPCGVSLATSVSRAMRSITSRR